MINRIRLLFRAGIDTFHFINRVNLKQILKIAFSAITVFDWRVHAQSQDFRGQKFKSYLHFLTCGIFTGEDVHIYFDANEYRNSYPTSIAKSKYPFLHYLARGTGKNPLIAFDQKYLVLNPDLVDFKSSLLYHYVKLGLREERDVAKYIQDSISTVEFLIQVPTVSPSPAREKILVFLNFECVDSLHLSDSDDLSFLKLIQVTTTESELGSDSVFEDDLSVQVSLTGNAITINVLAFIPVFLDLKWLRRLILQFKMNQSFDQNSFVASLKFLLYSISKRLPSRYEVTGNNFSFSKSQYAYIPPDLSLVRFKFKEVVVRQFEDGDPQGETILLVSHEDSYTGAPLYLLQMARYLRLQGMKVMILSIRPEYRSGVFSESGFETLYVDDLSMESNFDALWILNSGGKVVVRDFLQRLSPIQVWVNSINASCIVEIATNMGIPTALFVHESFGFRSEKNLFFSVYDTLFAKALESANIVIFGSEFAQKSFERSDLYVHSDVVLSLKDDTTSMPIDKRCSSVGLNVILDIPPQARVFLSMATFEERKRIQDIILAFQQAQIENAILILVGSIESDDYSNYIKEISRNDERIQIHPVTPCPEIYYEVADVLILASESETYPLVLQDAIHWNLLRIVSQFPGYTSSCDQNNALLFEVSDVNALAQLLIEASKPTKRSSEIIRNAKSDFKVKRESYLKRILRLQSDLSCINVTIARNS